MLGVLSVLFKLTHLNSISYQNSMLGLMDNQLKYENIPNGNVLCFNNNCQEKQLPLQCQQTNVVLWQ